MKYFLPSKILLYERQHICKKRAERKNNFTYTSTSTGNAASLSSSRQLGGNNICTAARVPCVNEISNERCDGSAND